MQAYRGIKIDARDAQGRNVEYLALFNRETCAGFIMCNNERVANAPCDSDLFPLFALQVGAFVSSRSHVIVSSEVIVARDDDKGTMTVGDALYNVKYSLGEPVNLTRVIMHKGEQYEIVARLDAQGYNVCRTRDEELIAQCYTLDECIAFIATR